MTWTHGGRKRLATRNRGPWNFEMPEVITEVAAPEGKYSFQ